MHEEADWDEGILKTELLDMAGLGLDLSLTGLDGFELDKFLASPIVPVTRPGDLWLLGPHRVLCGDSTASDATVRACGAASGIPQPLLMVTDPPYGVDYDPAWRNEVLNDVHPNRATGLVRNDDRVDWAPAWRLFPGDVAYVWHAGIYAGAVAASLFAVEFEIRGQIIWKKQQIVMSRGAYHWQHEPCWYAVRKGRTAHWCGDRKQSTVWEVSNLNPFGQDQAKREKHTGHGTQKPVEIMRRPIVNHTKQGQAVYDPFLGSGSTLIAAEMTGRACYGLEIDPKYCDVIIERWQNFTGKKATLEGHGATFEHARDGRRLQAEDEIKEEVLEILERRNAAQEITQQC